MKTKMHRLSIELLPVQHKRIKTLATLKGQSMREYVLEKLLGKITKKEKEFNNLTKEAIKNIDTENELTEYNNIEDLFKKFK